ncbi:uncharacterized protein DS421_11g343590 [Arachis hypogaea]|nr:uncharacterized protein DS421_11g343590 [Arachis hypogaea]
MAVPSILYAPPFHHFLHGYSLLISSLHLSLIIYQLTNMLIVIILHQSNSFTK